MPVGRTLNGAVLIDAKRHHKRQPCVRKECSEPMLKQTGFYQRLKASSIHDFYWMMADRRRIYARYQEVAFYRSVLGGCRRGDLIFDIGANDGSKTDVFLRLGARVIAIEPDELNQEVIRSKFLRYRLLPRAVTIVGKAMSDRTATETMWVDGPGSAVNTLSRKWVETLKSDKIRFEHTNGSLDFSRCKTVETTTLEDLICTHGKPFFIKIDVEGYEANVLRGLKRPVPVLSFEINLPEFRPEGLECVRLLEDLAADGRFNYAVDCKRGMALDQWLDAPDFARVLEQCSENTIEVIWKTPIPIRR